MICRFQYNPKSPASENMDRDRAMMTEEGPVLRVYTWEPATISLGISQDPSVVDRAACAREGIDVVSRFTGGAAVLHKDDVTYSFFCPSALEPRLNARDVRARFRDVFLALFQDLGIEAAAKGSGKWVMPASAVCFHAPAEHEILVGGKKIVGSAQSVKRRGVFQHGSLVLKNHEALLCRLVPDAEPVDAVAGIWEFCPTITPQEICEGLVRHVGRVFGWEMCDA